MVRASLARRHVAVAITLSAVALPAPVMALGDEGHEVVALIARHYLTPATTAKVDELLSGPALTGQPDDKANVPSDMASRATWADKYRDSDRRDDPTSRYPETR